MARELGMNPKKLGKLDNHDQEPWKIPLRQYIESLYFKRFGKERPDGALSIEEKIQLDETKKARKRAAKAERKQAGSGICRSTQGRPRLTDSTNIDTLLP